MSRRILGVIFVVHFFEVGAPTIFAGSGVKALSGVCDQSLLTPDRDRRRTASVGSQRKARLGKQ